MWNLRSINSAMHRYSIIDDGTPLNKAEKALILLHGRGGTAEDIMILADEFCDKSFYVAAPQATGNSWYPYSFLNPEVDNEPWLSSAIQIVRSVINSVSYQLPNNKIYLMGFSQGACLALEFAARFPSDFGGVVAFSGGLIGDRINREKYKGSFDKTKIFIGNSNRDPHIPLSRSAGSAELLHELGADVMHKIYQEMAHTIIPEEIEDVKKFMFV